MGQEFQPVLDGPAAPELQKGELEVDRRAWRYEGAMLDPGDLHSRGLRVHSAFLCLPFMLWGPHGSHPDNGDSNTNLVG